jgi:hypothetical protein
MRSLDTSLLGFRETVFYPAFSSERLVRMSRSISAFHRNSADVPTGLYCTQRQRRECDDNQCKDESGSLASNNWDGAPTETNSEESIAFRREFVFVKTPA